jgi:probable HAF family extracellular repeat protein
MSAPATRRIALGGTVVVLLALLFTRPASTVQASSAGGSASVPEYLVVDLGALGGDRNVARGLNALGHVAGRSGSLQGTGGRAFVWTPVGGARSLGTLPGGDFSGASGINSAGQVVGSSNTLTALRAFLWSAQQGFEDLGTLPGDSSSQALAISDAGVVAGFSSGPVGIRAFVWTRSKGMEELGALHGFPDSVAVDLNERGDRVGYASRADGIDRAVRWAPGVEDLGVLPPPHHIRSRATGINEAGDVVGYSSGSGVMHAFLWNERDGMQDLGTLPGGTNSRALSIGPSGRVVGGSDSSHGPRAYVWTREDGMRDLNDLVDAPGLVLIEALKINRVGQIVAAGVRTHPEGELHAAHDDHGGPDHEAPTDVFLLTPLD